MSQNHFEDKATDALASQPGILQYGLFVTFSQLKSAGKTYCYVRGVSRTGNLGRAEIFSWSTGPMPNFVYESLTDRIRAILDEEITFRFGIQEEFPD